MSSVSLKVRIKLLHTFPLASHFSVLTEKPEACSVELFTRYFHFGKYHKLRNNIYFSHLLQFPKINWCTSHQPTSFSVMLPLVAYLGRYRSLPKTGVLTSRQILKQIWFDSSSFWHSWSPKDHTTCHIDGCANLFSLTGTGRGRRDAYSCE